MTPITVASTAVQALEALAPELPHGPAESAARAAIAAVKRALDAELFDPVLAPADAAVLADFQILAPRPPRLASLRALHRTAYPALRTVERGPRGQVLYDAAVEAEILATNIPLSERPAARLALLDAARVALASDLLDDPVHGPAAQLRARELPALERRIEAVVAVRQRAAAEALHQQRQEDVALEAARRDAIDTRRETLRAAIEKLHHASRFFEFRDRLREATEPRDLDVLEDQIDRALTIDRASAGA